MDYENDFIARKLEISKFLIKLGKIMRVWVNGERKNKSSYWNFDLDQQYKKKSTTEKLEMSLIVVKGVESVSWKMQETFCRSLNLSNTFLQRLLLANSIGIKVDRTCQMLVNRISRKCRLNTCGTWSGNHKSEEHVFSTIVRSSFS